MPTNSPRPSRAWRITPPSAAPWARSRVRSRWTATAGAARTSCGDICCPRWPDGSLASRGLRALGPGHRHHHEAELRIVLVVLGERVAHLLLGDLLVSLGRRH